MFSDKNLSMFMIGRNNTGLDLVNTGRQSWCCTIEMRHFASPNSASPIVEFDWYYCTDEDFVAISVLYHISWPDELFLPKYIQMFWTAPNRFCPLVLQIIFILLLSMALEQNLYSNSKNDISSFPESGRYSRNRSMS